MHHSFIPTITNSLILACAGFAFADADLEKARTLFPAFNHALCSDDEEAEEIYQILSNLSSNVQQRLLTWLDQEYEEKKAAYHRLKSGGGSGLHSDSHSDDAKIKPLQKQLSDIRNTSNEGEMKKALKETGMPALVQLLRIKGSTIRSLDNIADSLPDPGVTRTALKEAKQVGEYRFRLRRKLKQPVKDLNSCVESMDDEGASGNKAATIAMNQKAASVLAKNEKLKDKISGNEYSGILELNHWRIAAGMQPLLIDPKLCDASRDHCKDMEKLKFFAHESPVKGKKTPWDRAKNFGTTARGENIAINNSTEAANRAWFYSPGHHKNMFKPSFSVIGLGVHGRHYCQLFR